MFNNMMSIAQTNSLKKEQKLRFALKYHTYMYTLSCISYFLNTLLIYAFFNVNKGFVFLKLNFAYDKIYTGGR